MESDKKSPIGPRHVMAYGVHVFTALGAALGFLALEAALHGDLHRAFSWLAVALFVDAVDGPLARRLNVRDTASRYDGSVLDLVVDFVTYVFVPAAILLRAEVIAPPFGMLSGLLITVGSALYFADTAMKTEDYWFRGFPAVWNVIAFYIVVFSPPTAVSVAIIVLLTLAMFLPVIFVHPVRVRRWRPLTMGVLAVTCLAACVALFVEKLQASMPIKAVLGFGGFYFLALGLLRLVPEGKSAAKDA